MPEFLIKKLEAEYGKKSPRVWQTLNAIGAARGNKETQKGADMEAKHERDMKAKKATGQHWRKK